ncbi:hypothetical protein NLI96_g11784 [Meripilus lineatus]|uniref:Polyprotein n=1 Tax=Meripilus lineatus TaxID=2056292 RepID=A0AAD5UTL8_9APHY|nr:hypothetical protein NLI96_g11784 [Physisporinus lineatus]
MDPPEASPTPTISVADINRAFQDVPKLSSNGSNYLLWSERAHFALVMLDLDTLLKAAPTDATASISKKILVAMFGKMDNGIFMLTRKNANPFDLVKFLDARFDANTDKIQTDERSKLFAMDCTHDSGFAKHLDNVERQHTRLGDMGCSITDEDYIAVISKVPPSYQHVVDREKYVIRQTNLLGAQFTEEPKKWVDIKLTPVMLLRALRAEAQSRGQGKGGKSKGDSANSASGGGGNGGGKGKGRRGKGKGKGAAASDASGSKDSAPDLSTITCYRCKGIGHKSNKCPSPRNIIPKDTANAATPTTPTTPAAKDTPTVTANTASIVEINSDDELWATSAIDPSIHYSPYVPNVIDCSGLDDQGFVEDLHASAAVVEALIAPSESRCEIFDSGASRHMSPFRDQFENFHTIPTRQIRAANSHNFQAYGMGNLIIRVPNGKSWSNILLRDTLYAPQMHATLASLGQFDDAGYAILIHGGTLTIKSPSGTKIGKIHKDHSGLYRVSSDDSASAASIPSLSLFELHCRLGHISYRYLKKLHSSGSLKGLVLDPNRMEETECPSCIKAKITRAPIEKSRASPRAMKFGDLIHMDVWGPARVRTIHHSLYTLTIIDDATCWLEAPLMKSKDEAFAKYVSYQTLTKTQHGVTFKVVHSDRGGEFLSNEFTNYLQSEGTERRLTVHDTPEHNGVAERTHRTIFEMVRACMTGTGVPQWLWGEAFQFAVYVFNRTPRSAIGFKIPYEVRFGSPPDLSHLRPWGSLCYVKVDALNKLADRAEEARYMGPDSTSNGFRVYWEKRKVISIERNVIFSARVTSPVEGEYNITLPMSDAKLAPALLPPTQIPEVISEPIDPKLVSGKRSRTPSEKARLIAQGIGLACQEIEDGEIDEEYVMANLANVSSEIVDRIPRTYKEALTLPDAEEWIGGTNEEFSRLKARNAWVYVYPPKDANIIGSRLVFALKRDANHKVTKHRVRLVAQGCFQVEGADYLFDDVFAPVARMETNRALCALAASKDWEIGQMDVKSAYLYGQMEEGEEIYMRPPPGVKPEGILPGQVMKLLVCIYGLKQAGRRWYKKVQSIMKKIGLTRSNFDHAVFFRLLSNGGLIAISLHVDDATGIAPNRKLLTELKDRIKAEVECVDSGDLSWMLGIEIKRDRSARTISFSQHAYLDQILARYGFVDLRPLVTPVDPHVTLDTSQCATTPSDIDFMRDKPYREALGALMYASVATRPDITYAVSSLARFSQNPGPTHWTALKRVFAYLKGTREMWLTVGGRDVKLMGYSDADGMSQEGRRPISGYVYLIGGAISWSSKRQDIVTLSTTEAEYVALTHAAKEAIWLKNLLGELFPRIPFTPVTIQCDNQGAIALSKDDRFHSRTKHIDIRYHFIRNVVELKYVQTYYCPTDEMVADILTKGLPLPKAKLFTSLMGLGKV